MNSLPSDLPAPDPAALALSEQLSEQLRQRIREQGSIGFDQFMEAALYQPGLGYYSGGLAKFGPEGDFITAPELGKLFAECLAARLAPVLNSLQQPTLLELGGGSGCLMRDLLLALERRDALPERYAMLERSASCRAMQTETAGQLPERLRERIVWLDSPPESEFEGVILGNEVLDALPVQRFAIANRGEIREIRVGLNRQQGFEWLQQPAEAELAERVRARFSDSQIPLNDGLEGELCSQLAPWLASVSQGLKRGLVLMIDYGYPRRALYSARHAEGTLVCHYRHRVHHDPLWQPGLQDISAFVDFSAVAEAAADNGLDLAGYTSQAGFLLTACPSWLEKTFSQADQSQVWAMARELRRLTSPEEMGERFQVMALTRDLGLPTRDWIPDLRASL